MNKEIKEKWIEALLSGEYKQTEGVLHNTAGYCCLGVLCDLLKDEGSVSGEWLESEDNDEDDRGILIFSSADDDDEPYSTMPPPSVYAVSDLNDDTATALSQKNDKGESFTQIAEYIKEML